MAKIARMIVACHKSGTSLLSDVDMMPLRGSYYRLGAREGDKNQLVVYSSDAYTSWAPDRYPICYLLADRSTWRSLVNPQGYDTHDLLESWRGRKRVDFKDDPFGEHFSDESLLQWLLRQWASPKRIVQLDRGWVRGIAKDRIDRARWEFVPAALARNAYIDAHLPRPSSPEHRIDLLLQSTEGVQTL
jgi:hypothetical protein